MILEKCWQSQTLIDLDIFILFFLAQIDPRLSHIINKVDNVDHWQIIFFLFSQIFPKKTKKQKKTTYLFQPMTYFFEYLE